MAAGQAPGITAMTPAMEPLEQPLLLNQQEHCSYTTFFLSRLTVADADQDPRIPAMTPAMEPLLQPLLPSQQDHCS
jgi:hypothetical protein